jgi:hypothetical protein
MHALVVVIVGEGEVVLGLEPAVVGAAKSFEGSAFNHCLASLAAGAAVVVWGIDRARGLG